MPHLRHTPAAHLLSFFSADWTCEFKLSQIVPCSQHLSSSRTGPNIQHQNFLFAQLGHLSSQTVGLNIASAIENNSSSLNLHGLRPNRKYSRSQQKYQIHMRKYPGDKRVLLFLPCCDLQIYASGQPQKLTATNQNSTFSTFLSLSCRTPNNLLKRKKLISSSLYTSGKLPTSPKTWPTSRSALVNVGST